MLVATVVFIFTGCEEEEANKKPIISITNPASGTSIPKDTTITISAEAEDEDGKLKEVRFYLDGTDIGSASSTPYNYEWNLGDVSTGTHSLQAEAIDAENATAQDTIQITVGESPIAAFEADTTDITVDSTVNFEDKSTGSPTSWSWDFGDGATSTEENPSHTYSSEGTYKVELTVSNEYGEDTETKTDYITVGSAPTANFSADQTNIQPESSVKFTDESTGSPTSWSWDFGDGATSTEENPSHTYSLEGTYNVELTVSNDYGEDTETKTDYVTVESGIDLDIEMVTVSGGTFDMGCTSEQSNCRDIETPAHTVTVDDFEMSKYEITNQQYADFMNEIGANSDGSYNGTEYLDMDAIDIQINYSDGQFVAESGKENYPVIKVTWYGAKAFCEHYGGRLPTEAEWEFAARGGNSASDPATEYAGSNTIDEVAWYSGNCSSSQEVGTKSPNELGLYDMSGNVWNWCNDWYGSDYYTNSPQDNPQGPSSGSKRILRGGSWYNDAEASRVGARNAYRPEGVGNGHYGFRLVHVP